MLRTKIIEEREKLGMFTHCRIPHPTHYSRVLVPGLPVPPPSNHVAV